MNRTQLQRELANELSLETIENIRNRLESTRTCEMWEKEEPRQLQWFIAQLDEMVQERNDGQLEAAMNLLHVACLRVQMANTEESNPILSAWLPEAQKLIRDILN